MHAFIDIDTRLKLDDEQGKTISTTFSLHRLSLCQEHRRRKHLQLSSRHQRSEMTHKAGVVLTPTTVLYM